MKIITRIKFLIRHICWYISPQVRCSRVECVSNSLNRKGINDIGICCTGPIDINTNGKCLDETILTDNELKEIIGK